MGITRTMSFALLALIGCTPATVRELPSGAVPIAGPLDIVVQEYNSGINDRRRLVIRDAAAWQAFWNQAHGRYVPVPSAPVIDFSANIVIAATMGGRPTGGYGIEIESLHEASGDVFAIVIERSAGPSCGTTQAFTAPVIAVRVPRPGADVTFVDQSKTIDC